MDKKQKDRRGKVNYIWVGCGAYLIYLGYRVFSMALIIDWRVALVVWGTFFLLAALTKYVSLGSICAGISFPLISLYVYRDPVIVLAALLIGTMVVWQHRGNIRRLLSGTESKFKLHHKSGEGRP